MYSNGRTQVRLEHRHKLYDVHKPYRSKIRVIPLTIFPYSRWMDHIRWLSFIVFVWSSLKALFARQLPSGQDKDDAFHFTTRPCHKWRRAHSSTTSTASPLVLWRLVWSDRHINSIRSCLKLPQLNHAFHDSKQKPRLVWTTGWKWR